MNLVAAIESSASTMQSDFAAIALDALLGAYEREFDAVAAPSRRFSAREESKQRRWAGAVRRFIENIYEARDAVNRGAPVQLIADPPMDVMLLVEGRLVVVSSPQIGHPETLEDAVLQEFCALYPCAAKLRGKTAERPRPPGGNWSVSRAAEASANPHASRASPRKIVARKVVYGRSVSSSRDGSGRVSIPAEDRTMRYERGDEPHFRVAVQFVPVPAAGYHPGAGGSAT